MPSIVCIGCGGPVRDDRLARGNRLECEHCAGLTIEVVDRDGELALRQVHFASCPACDAQLEVPPDASPGDTVNHCGRTLRLTYAFGGYALQ